MTCKTAVVVGEKRKLQDFKSHLGEWLEVEEDKDRWTGKSTVVRSEPELLEEW